MALSKAMPLGVTAVMLAELDFGEQVALCAELGVTHYVYRPRHIADDVRGKPYASHGNHKFDLTPQRLLEEGGELARRLRDAGLVPFSSVPNVNVTMSDDDLRLHLEGAAAGGAASLRVQPGPYPKTPFNYEHYLSEQREGYERVIALAESIGVKPVIEMHAGSAAAGPGLAAKLVDLFDPEKIGLILDLPNAGKEGFVQPSLAVSVVERWVDHLHIGGCRKVEGERDENGFRRVGHEFCEMDAGDVYIPEWLEALESAGLNVPLVIEDFSGGKSGEQKLRENVAALKRLFPKEA